MDSPVQVSRYGEKGMASQNLEEEPFRSGSEDWDPCNRNGTSRHSVRGSIPHHERKIKRLRSLRSVRPEVSKGERRFPRNSSNVEAKEAHLLSEKGVRSIVSPGKRGKERDDFFG
jgi:hypothetical protein